MAKIDQALVNGTTYEIVPEIAPLFSENTAYAVDDCVIKDAVLYRFTVAHAAGPWIGTDAEEITVGKELTGLNADLNVLEDKLIDGGIIADYLKPYLIGYSNINEDGSIRNTTGTVNQVYAVNVENRSSILASEADVYGYYSSKPTEGSVAMDGTRHFSHGVRPYIIDIPTGAKYVAIRVASGTIPTFSVIDPQPLLSEMVGAIEKTSNDIVKDLSLISDDYPFSCEDITESGVVTKDYFVSYTGEANGPYPDRWKYITFDVAEGEMYSVRAYAGLNARLWLLKNGNELISFSQDDSAVNLKTEQLTIPPSATHLIVNASTANTGQISAVSVEKTTTKRIIKPNAVINNSFAGKVLCCAGDSITYGADMDAEGISDISGINMYQGDANGDFIKVTSQFRKTWGFQIAERNGMTFYNAGVSGSTMQGLTDKNGFSLANGRYTKLPDNIDYLVIWFGWNDTAYGTLGAITDTENTSYYGGYNVVLPYLINKYPYTKIALIVPFGTDEGHRNAIRQLGNKWGVAVWDNYQGGTPLYYGKEDSVGVNQAVVTANRAKFQANGAHPNYKGHTQLGDMIEEFLRGI